MLNRSCNYYLRWTKRDFAAFSLDEEKDDETNYYSTHDGYQCDIAFIKLERSNSLWGDHLGCRFEDPTVRVPTVRVSTLLLYVVSVARCLVGARAG